MGAACPRRLSTKQVALLPSLDGTCGCAHKQSGVARLCLQAAELCCCRSSPPLQFFKDGASLPATVIALEGGNIVTHVKTAEKDGYTAVQVGLT